MDDPWARTRRLLGSEAIERLSRARVAVFGLGGVGGYVCEALVRSGIGAFDLIDNDRISVTNLNRQIIALHSTIGREKTEVMRERMLDISPGADIRIHSCFVLPENVGGFPFEEYDYVVDAVDTVAAKLAIILRAGEAGVPVLSSMGTGNKLDASRLRISDISETRVCPLARVMRRELRRRGVEHLKVLWSDEEPRVPFDDGEGRRVPFAYNGEKARVYFAGNGEEPGEGFADAGEKPSPGRRSIPGSSSFVPPAAGLLIAQEVVQDLCGEIL